MTRRVSCTVGRLDDNDSLIVLCGSLISVRDVN